VALPGHVWQVIDQLSAAPWIGLLLEGVHSITTVGSLGREDYVQQPGRLDPPKRSKYFERVGVCLKLEDMPESRGDRSLEAAVTHLGCEIITSRARVRIG